MVLLQPKTDPSQNICFPFKWGLFTLPNEKLILLWDDCHSPASPKSDRVLCLRPCGFQPHFPHLSHSSDHVCVCVCVCVLKKQRGTFLVVQWFRLQASTTGGLGSIPGQGSSTYHLVKPENKPHIVPTQNCMLSHLIVSNSLQPHAPLSMGFPRQEYWSELPFPPPGDLSNPGIKPWSPALQADFLPSEPPGKPTINLLVISEMTTQVQFGTFGGFCDQLSLIINSLCRPRSTVKHFSLFPTPCPHSIPQSPTPPSTLRLGSA